MDPSEILRHQFWAMLGEIGKSEIAKVRVDLLRTNERRARELENDGFPEEAEALRSALSNNGESMLSLPSPKARRGRPPKAQNGGD